MFAAHRLPGVAAAAGTGKLAQNHDPAWRTWGAHAAHRRWRTALHLQTRAISPG
jgi:hypothetical protein